MSSKAVYDAGAFNVASLEDARRVILAPENGRTSDDRWELETPYLRGLIDENLHLTSTSVVVDYGCGVGRLAKELISRFDCRVVGVDTSAGMRSLAERYVNSDRFVACAPEALNQFGDAFGDAAIAVWVLQHCLQVEQDIERIRRALKIDGQLFVVNENGRRLPVRGGWFSDGLDVRQMLANRFRACAQGQMDAEIVTPAVSERTFWANYKLADEVGKMNGANPSEASLKSAGTAGETDSQSTASHAASIPSPGAEPESASPSASTPDASAPAVKRAYPPPAEVPTQQGPHGVRFDFNDGCRVMVAEAEHPWRVRLSDLDTGNILFETELKAGRVNSTKRYYRALSP